MAILKTLLRISIPVTILILIHYYLWARLVRDPQWPLAVQRSLLLLLVVAAFLIPVGLVIGWFTSSPVGRAVAWAGYTWLGTMFLLLVGTAVSELFRLANAVTDLGRREVLLRGISLGVGLACASASAYGVKRALRPVEVKEVDISLSRLPSAANGLTIAQLTDVHIGPTIRREFIEDIVSKTNALQPDIIALTGDMVDGSVEHLREHFEPFANLRARYGVYFVTGNHEYYSGADAWIAEIQRLGIRVLRNERVEVGPEGGTIDLVGIDDWTAHNFGPHHGADLPRALSGRDSSRLCVLLAHNPMAGKEAIENGIDLQISGHTHGGQIWPFNRVVQLVNKWVVGLYLEGATQIYVSPGTGYWGPPMRLGTKAEITKFVLRA